MAHSLPSLAGPLPKGCHGPTPGLNCVGCSPRHASVFDTPFPGLLRPPYFNGKGVGVLGVGGGGGLVGAGGGMGCVCV